MRKIAALMVALAAVSGTAFAQGPGTGFKTDPCSFPDGAKMPGSGNLIKVGPTQTYKTIQAGVDAAAEGDTVLIDEGVYHEAVVVRTPGLRIRGQSRSGVVLDGGSELEIGIDVTDTDRVVIENMTAHNFTRHAFFWYHATGYWGRYLTAYNQGLYGIYAFDSRCGQIDHSYTSGNADSGFYIGECFPCDAVITNIVSETDALGYSGTNAGGNLVIRDSIWRNNAMGIVPNSLDGEERPPQRGVTIKNNLLLGNNNKTAPGTSLAGTFYGVGIAIAGGQGNVVAGNVVTDHALAGIVLSPLPDEHVWIPSGNTIWGNVVTHDAEDYPESMDLGQAATSGPGNCWADNTFGTSAPVMIQDIYSCGSTLTPPGGDPRVEMGLLQGLAGLNGRVRSDWRTWPAPTAPEAFIEQPSDNGTGAYEDDQGVDFWLPALGVSSAS